MVQPYQQQSAVIDALANISSHQLPLLGACSVTNVNDTLGTHLGIWQCRVHTLLLIGMSPS